MARRFVPDRGDVVWLAFEPHAGHEQRGHRPALVISPVEYNGKVGLALCCPITSKVKGYPFEVELPAGRAIAGAILADHIKSVDWRARGARFVTRVSTGVVDEVVAKVLPLLTSADG